MKIMEYELIKILKNLLRYGMKIECREEARITNKIP